MPAWRNWQTRYVQVVVSARMWGFESLRWYHSSARTGLRSPTGALSAFRSRRTPGGRSASVTRAMPAPGWSTGFRACRSNRVPWSADRRQAILGVRRGRDSGDAAFQSARSIPRAPRGRPKRCPGHRTPKRLRRSKSAGPSAGGVRRCFRPPEHRGRVPCPPECAYKASFTPLIHPTLLRGSHLRRSDPTRQSLAQVRPRPSVTCAGPTPPVIPAMRCAACPPSPHSPAVVLPVLPVLKVLKAALRFRPIRLPRGARGHGRTMRTREPLKTLRTRAEELLCNGPNLLVSCPDYLGHSRFAVSACPS